MPDAERVLKSLDKVGPSVNKTHNRWQVEVGRVHLDFC